MLTLELFIQSITILIPIYLIYDILYIPEVLKQKLYYIRYTKDSVYEPYSLKPLDCGLCMSFWITVAMYITLPLVLTPVVFIHACLTAWLYYVVKQYVD